MLVGPITSRGWHVSGPIIHDIIGEIPVPELNYQGGWIAILIGLCVGTILGLFFHQEDWLGGYSSWRRRMIRLGHVSFFGTGFLNLAFAFSVEHLRLATPPPIPSVAFLVGAVTMPMICFLSAWRDSFRHLFFIPVVSLLLATGDLVLRGLFR
jgi:hypothetical protein